MFESVNLAVQTVAPQGNVNLGSQKISTGCTVSANSETVRLNRPGFYKVEVYGSVSGATSTEIQLALVNSTTNLVEQGGRAVISGLTVGDATSYPFAIGTIVQVPNGCGCVRNMKAFTVKNIGTEAVDVQNFNIVVTKLA